MQFDPDIPADPQALERWLARQPPEVQEAAALFPVRQPIYIGSTIYWVVGYTPEGALVSIKCDPNTITRSQFHDLMKHPDLLDPVKIQDIVTRH
jgi:hypothetical protein